MSLVVMVRFYRSRIGGPIARCAMDRWRKTVGLALVCGGALAGLCQPLHAATSSTLDIISEERAGDASDTVDIGRVAPVARQGDEAAKLPPVGNPLWSIPLSTLSATHARPIFSASRRAPQRAVVAPPVEPVAAPPAPKGPERPSLALIGAIVGDRDAVAVFLDQTNQKIVRLRQGEAHSGWVLNSVLGREVTLKKADQIETLGFPSREIPAK
jgi:general secretion pathway protein N